MIKCIYEKRTANIILNGESFSSKIKMRKFTSSLLFSIILEVQDRAIRKEKVVKGIQVGKEVGKLFLFTDDMTVYIENPKECTHTKKPVRANK